MLAPVSSSIPRSLPNIGSSSTQYAYGSDRRTYYRLKTLIAGFNHLLRSLCPDDVLLGRYAMDHPALVSSPYLLMFAFLSPSSAWFFFKLMGVSGAEAVVAAASPWIGQGHSCKVCGVTFADGWL